MEASQLDTRSNLLYKLDLDCIHGAIRTYLESLQSKIPKIYDN